MACNHGSVHKANEEEQSNDYPSAAHKLAVTYYSTTLLTGCWDRTETNDIAFVATSSVDLEDDGKYRVRLYVPLPGSMGGASGGEAVRRRQELLH